MTAIELKATLWNDIEQVNDENLLRKLMETFKSVISSNKSEEAQQLPINAVAIEEDKDGKIILTTEMRQAYTDGMRQYKAGQCHTVEDFNQRFAKWL